MSSDSTAKGSLGPCDQILIFNEVCGAPGFKTLGIHTYCTSHYGKFLLSLEPSGMGVGYGLQDGPLHAEFGPGFAQLKCWKCNAEWVDVVGSTCPWCVESVKFMNEWQAELTLRAPELDLADIRRPKALEAWKERLKKAREAGIITREEAKNVFGRELRRTT